MISHSELNTGVSDPSAMCLIHIILEYKFDISWVSRQWGGTKWTSRFEYMTAMWYWYRCPVSTTTKMFVTKIFVTDRIRSMEEGNVFTGVCHSVHVVRGASRMHPLQ